LQKDNFAYFISNFLPIWGRLSKGFTQVPHFLKISSGSDVQANLADLLDFIWFSLYNFGKFEKENTDQRGKNEGDNDRQASCPLSSDE